MTQCCNDYGVCEHGPGCPAGAVRVAPRTCEALGICQHPERECPGACEQIPRLPGVQHDELAQPTEPLELIEPLTVVKRALLALICLAAACIGGSLMVVGGKYIGVLS